jgi:hypothetical protein
MTREELIEVMARAITKVSLGGPYPSAERMATAALLAIEAAGVKLVPAIPTWPMIKTAQCSVEAYDKMIALSPYAPPRG